MGISGIGAEWDKPKASFNTSFSFDDYIAIVDNEYLSWCEHGSAACIAELGNGHKAFAF